MRPRRLCDGGLLPQDRDETQAARCEVERLRDGLARLRAKLRTQEEPIWRRQEADLLRDIANAEARLLRASCPLNTQTQ